MWEGRLKAPEQASGKPGVPADAESITKKLPEQHSAKLYKAYPALTLLSLLSCVWLCACGVCVLDL